MEFDDVIFLLNALKNHRSSITIDTPSAGLDFYIENDGSFWVEIYGYENSVGWAVSEIDVDIGEEILKVAVEGKKLGNIIPTTDKEWDAYSM